MDTKQLGSADAGRLSQHLQDGGMKTNLLDKNELLAHIYLLRRTLMPCMPSTRILMVVALFSTASGAQEREHLEGIPASQNGISEDRSVEAEPVPIIVLGEKEAEKERVVLGSRIAKKPLFDSKTHTVATSTGTPGLTPQSGMDPSGGGIRRVTRTSCESSDSKIRADVACALIAAMGAMENGDWNTVRGYLIPLANTDSLYPVEHRALQNTSTFQLAPPELCRTK